MNTNDLNIYAVLGDSVRKAKRSSWRPGDQRRSFDFYRFSYIDSGTIEKENQLSFRQLKLSKRTKIREVIKSFGLELFFVHEYIEYIITYAYVIKRTPPNLELSFGNKKEVENHQNSTLEDLGIINDEVIIIDTVEIERRHTGNIVCYNMMASPTTIDFYNLVKDDLPERPDHLHMVLLYTDSDIELARLVRECYADLHILSGRKLHLHVIEKLVIENSFSEYLRYWRSLLSEKLYVVWASLGWLNTRPYDKTQCYEIGKKLGISPKHFPCAVLFDTPSPERALTFPIGQTSIEFFRTLLTELNRIIDGDDNKKSREWELDELEFAYLLESDPNRENELYEKVKQQYTKIRNEILAKASKKSPNEFVFYGKTVFINQPQGNVSLNNFQND